MSAPAPFDVLVTSYGPIEALRPLVDSLRLQTLLPRSIAIESKSRLSKLRRGITARAISGWKVPPLSGITFDIHPGNRRRKLSRLDAKIGIGSHHVNIGHVLDRLYEWRKQRNVQFGVCFDDPQIVLRRLLRHGW